MRVLEESIFLDRKDDTFRNKPYDKRSKRIRDLMKEANLTYEKMAETIDYSPNQLKAVINGKRPLTDKLLRQIAGALNVRPQYILEGGPRTIFASNVQDALAAVNSFNVVIQHLKNHGITFSFPDDESTCTIEIRGERFTTSFDAVNAYVQSLEKTFSVMAYENSKMLPRL